MNEIKEVFFAPSIDWFKKKAKQLRKHIGCDVITHTGSLSLLAKVYGFLSWRDFLEYQVGDQENETFWDSQLDEKTFEERRYMQLSALMGALRISESEAIEVLNEVEVSGTGAARAASVEADDILEFSSKLAAMLDQHREEARGAGAVSPPKPVVTYKKRHMIDRDAVTSRLH
ncbi:hypothetical protein PQR66_34780 [Paraburkholderia agricolaris]|uniref:Uncharacterized protein n=1 Tax=Paraburkholderia agricolaris TaxID=2152888 RepID=A0ABW8ZZP6_9BURK